MASVVIIGARCRRQGIGEHVSRAFAAAGAEVRAVVGTSQTTADEARDALAAGYDIHCTAYDSLAAALDRERPDIVAICSPYGVHLEQLRAVARSGAHCLCEKPLWWGEGVEHARATEAVVDPFIHNGRYLALVTQWPYTLPAYYRLHPEVEGTAVETFQMELSPIAGGPTMVLDAVPHLLSMLHHLVGVGEVVAPWLSFADAAQETMALGFDYRHAAGTTTVRFAATVCATKPRPAAYAINHRRAERRIHLLDYRMSLAAGAAQVAMDDPLDLLVANFLAQAVRGNVPDRQRLIYSVTALAQIFALTGQEADSLMS